MSKDSHRTDLKSEPYGWMNEGSVRFKFFM